MANLANLQSMHDLTQGRVNEINKILFSFLWGNKTAKIKKDTIIGNISDGGLKMPDIISVYKTAKISWIK